MRVEALGSIGNGNEEGLLELLKTFLYFVFQKRKDKKVLCVLKRRLIKNMTPESPPPLLLGF